jgi:hypothetical protein
MTATHEPDALSGEVPATTAAQMPQVPIPTTAAEVPGPPLSAMTLSKMFDFSKIKIPKSL